MKRLLSVVLGISLSVCMLTSCTNTGKDKKNTNSKGDVSKQSYSDGDRDEAMAIYDALFNLDNKITLDVEISDEELNKLQEDYEEYDSMRSKSPIYRRADKVTITIGEDSYEIEDVGIRLKGNMSRKPIYDDDGVMNLTHYKLSFNETFDDAEYYGDDVEKWDDQAARDERKARRFATLKTLDIKWNALSDQTYVRELYSHDMMRDFGIPAQKMNLSNLNMNGNHLGVVKIYEPMDGEFIDKNYDTERQDGDLFKAKWTYNGATYEEDIVTYGIDDNDASQTYNYALKTNKKTSDYSDIENLLSTIAKEDITKEEFESVLDTEQLAMFMAVNYFLGGPDDYRNNYNNHFLYFYADTSQAVLLPYDYDRVLGVTRKWNPEGTGMTYVSPYSDYAEGLSREQSNPIVIEAILEEKFILDEYKADLEEVVNSKWLTSEYFEENYYNKAKANYENDVEPSIELANVEMDMLEFSLEGTDNIASDSENISFDDYCTLIKEAYEEFK